MAQDNQIVLGFRNQSISQELFHVLTRDIHQKRKTVI